MCYIVEGLLGVKILQSRILGGERCDAVGQALLYEVVAEVHVVLRAYRECHIDGTCPVALVNHLKHHKVTFVEGAFALQRDNHAVGYGVLNHHSALADGLLVDGHVEGIGRYDVEVLVG